MKWTLILGILPLLIGCANVNPGPPPVDTARMSLVLADLHVTQALSGEVPVLVRDSMEAVFYDAVLADHGLTRQEFDSIMWILRQEPVWIDSVYSKAGEIVSRKMLEPIKE
ncbi:DUF4296 domain-containing protein [Lewinella sp. JB7]|uniref:DUF4296 domain-containing protein n=1 Tax=Lewinella sp. JB7 TaxID=2962887 RepID=UPI0020C96128|nr:DUF4296 domain-containing protein [Lewinella sp. JB7]MCP9234799.1 DUF4296 domain-containing protein [Lewinella sp. JB7]